MHRGDARDVRPQRIAARGGTTIWSSSTLRTVTPSASGASSTSRGVLAPGGRLVTESDRRAPLAIDLPLTFERRYGDTLIRIHGH